MSIAKKVAQRLGQRNYPQYSGYHYEIVNTGDSFYGRVVESDLSTRRKPSDTPKQAEKLVKELIDQICVADAEFEGEGE